MLSRSGDPSLLCAPRHRGPIILRPRNSHGDACDHNSQTAATAIRKSELETDLHQPILPEIHKNPSTIHAAPSAYPVNRSIRASDYQRSDRLCIVSNPHTPC
jgi:hypothetical protein